MEVLIRFGFCLGVLFYAKRLEIQPVFVLPGDVTKEIYIGLGVTVIYSKESLVLKSFAKAAMVL